MIIKFNYFLNLYKIKLLSKYMIKNNKEQPKLTINNNK